MEEEKSIYKNYICLSHLNMQHKILYKTFHLNYFKNVFNTLPIKHCLMESHGQPRITFLLSPLFSGLTCGIIQPLPSGTTEVDKDGLRNVLNLKYSQFLSYWSGFTPFLGEKGRTSCQVPLGARGYDA